MEKSKVENKNTKVKKDRLKERKGNFSRKTTETDIKLSLNLDGKGIYDIDTGVPFFNHMLEQFSKHSRFDMAIKAKGDIEVDLHHLIEDTGIVIGRAIKKLAGDKSGIRRFGFASVPMDETLIQTSVDFCGRSFFVYNPISYSQIIISGDNPFPPMSAEEIRKERNEIISVLNRNKDNKDIIKNPLMQSIIGESTVKSFFYDYVNIFFEAISKNALITLHINIIYGNNKHHMVEAMFKSAGIAVSDALKVVGGDGIPSTKGSI